MVGILVLAYLGLQLLLGLWIARRIGSEGDYFLAGRSLGMALVAFSLFATWFGAETCIGSAGAVYQQGLSGSRADPLGYGMCLFLMGALLASRLWKGGYTTLADFFRERYGPRTEALAAWLLGASSLIWGAAQLRAFGQVVSVTTEAPVEWAIVGSAALVIVYTLLGGLLGDIITDLVQGIILAVGLVLILVVTLGSVDLTVLGESLRPSRLSLLSPGESLWQRLDRWMIPVLGSLVAQELISRVLASRSHLVARNASFAACLIYLLFGSIPVLLGLVGPSLVPGLEDSERYLIALAKKTLPGVLFIIFSGALLSAMLSTLDSILLAVAALVSHNVVIPRLNSPTEREKLRCSRIVVVVSGLVCLALAVSSEGVYALVEYASSFGTAGILVITLAGLYSGWGGETAGLAALIVGAVAPILGEHVFFWEAPFLSAVTLSLVAFVGLNLKPMALPMLRP